MHPAPRLSREMEEKRLQALWDYEILDTEPEEAFDDVVYLASEYFKMPISLVSLVDEHRQFNKARHGLDAVEIDRETAFCTHAILGRHVFQIPDAANDPRFSKNPHVLGDLKIAFYAGAPLVTPEGFSIGTLCLIDQKPRHLSPAEAKALERFAKIVMTELELRKMHRVLKKRFLELQSLSSHNHEHEKLVRNMDKVHTMGTMASGIVHEVKRPLSIIDAASDSIQAELKAPSPDIEKIRSHAAMVHSQVEGMQELCEELISYFQDNNIGPIVEIDGSTLIHQTIETLKPVIDVRQVQVKVTIIEETRLRCAPPRALAILRTLVANALDELVHVSPDERRIELSIGRQADDPFHFAEIRVIDSGRGFDAHEASKIFDASITSKQSAGGIGLGLSLARDFAEAQAGHLLHIPSPSKRGSIFALRLPVPHHEEKSLKN